MVHMRKKLQLLSRERVSKELLTSSYDFHLPDELIATHPASPRDHARLLVYDRANDTITHAKFYELENFLPKDCALIFNNTKVIKARLFGKKESGGKVELLINRPLDAHTINVYIRGNFRYKNPPGRWCILSSKEAGISSSSQRIPSPS